MILNILYEDKNITVDGVYKAPEYDIGVIEEFIIDEIKFNDIIVTDEYEYEESLEIEEICIMQYKIEDQNNWEISNV